MKNKKLFLILLYLTALVVKGYSQSCWADFIGKNAFQQNSEWCWATGLQMVLGFYGVDKEQCDIVKDFYRIPSACDDPESANYPARSMFSVKQYLTSTNFDGIRFQASYKSGPLTALEIMNEINNCRPIMVEIRTSPFTNSTHMVLIIGFYFNQAINTLYLTIQDPWPYNWSSVYSGGEQGATYAQFYSIWSTTIYRIRKISDSDDNGN